MTRWFRFYDDAVNDPKVQRLEPKMFKYWVNLLCLASKNNGWLPAIDDVCFSLRISETEAGRIVDGLVSSNLIDEIDGHYCPHNWNSRQFKSDVTDPTNSTRQKRYRDKRRNGDSNGSNAVTDKRPYTEQIQIQSSDAIASGADAPIDYRKRLFDHGLAKLARLTGKGPDACRSFVGKCLKASSDDAILVLGLIEEAERNQVIDPSGWISARLKGQAHGLSGSKIIQAADDLRRKVAGFDGPPSGDIELRGGTGSSALRLLSNG